MKTRAVVIVELHDGRVSVERFPDHFAELNLFIPVADSTRLAPNLPR